MGHSLYESEETFNLDQYCASSLGEISYLKRLPISDLDRKNPDGWTPLMYASYRGFEDVVKYLLLKGVSTRDRDTLERTCLMLAVRSGSLDAVKLLCADERIDETDIKGWTALFHAVYLGREVTARYLISRGSNPLSRDIKGETPEGLATKIGMESIIDICRRKRTMDEKFPSKNTPMSHEKRSRMELTIPKTPNVLKKSTRTLLFKRNSYFPNKTASPLDSNKENVSPLPGNNTVQSTSPIYYLPTAILSPQPSPMSDINATFKIEGLSPKNYLFMKGTAKAPFQSESPPYSVQREDGFLSSPSVQTFLAHLNLDKYWPIFQQEEIDFETLLTFTEKNLRDIGINAYGPRHKILSALREYITNNGPPRLLKM